MQLCGAFLLAIGSSLQSIFMQTCGIFPAKHLCEDVDLRAPGDVVSGNVIPLKKIMYGKIEVLNINGEQTF